LAFNATWPFAGLFIYRDELALSSFFRRYTFPRETLLRIIPYHLFLSPGMKLEHNIADYPRFVVFWSRNLPDLQEALLQNAFPVAI